MNFILNSSSAKLYDSVKTYCLIKNQESNFDYIFEEIKNKLLDMKNEIKDLDDFILFAKKFSEDQGSGYKGGDLGYRRPKALVEEFSDVMKNTPLKKISDPFQSRFGWHILYVENMRSVDDTKSLIRKNVANVIRSNKAKLERDDWVAKLKEQAYIEIKEF